MHRAVVELGDRHAAAEAAGPVARRPLIWEATTPYFYARTTTDNRIIIGGEDDPELIEPAERDAAMPAKTERILRQLKTLCPDAELRADYAWSGAFSETSDGLPLIGRVRGYPHLYAAYGYGGNGITFSFLAARMIARMIAGEDEPWYDDLAVDRPSLADQVPARSGHAPPPCPQ